jgi:hypothetical protein
VVDTNLRSLFQWCKLDFVPVPVLVLGKAVPGLEVGLAVMDHVVGTFMMSPWLLYQIAMRTYVELSLNLVSNVVTSIRTTK